MKKKEKQLFKITKDIKNVKIQGATNIAKSAVKAYLLSPTKKTKKTLESLRPTEPLLQNVLDRLEKGKTKQEILNHFKKTQEIINKNVLKIINKNEVIFTHCHSTNVVKSLINAKKKKFEVYNTETRPLFQGRKTALELSKAGINVTNFPDSALGIALAKEQGTKKATKVFLGADAILRNGEIINKVGSETIAIIARQNKIPVYVIADSWKFSKKNIELEQRKPGEVWDNAPKNIRIKNPPFEKIPAKYINAIISDLGILSPKMFVRKVKSSF